MNWISAEQKPLDDNDCLVIYQVEQLSGMSRCLRAPVFWHEEKQAWIDEWGHELDVVKYVLIPELDDGTIFKPSSV